MELLQELLMRKYLIATLLFMEVLSLLPRPCAATVSAPGFWGVLLNGLPEKIIVGDDMTNSVFYIFKQTHEPLFRKDDGQNFTSRLLLSWGRNIASTEYTFCPDTKMYFDKDNQFGSEFFFRYIGDITPKYYKKSEIRLKKECVVVKFDRPRKGYLDFLSAYENAPAIRRSPVLEEGLGPFGVTDVSKERIVLERKVPVRNGYNKIILFDYKGSQDGNLNNPEIADFNLIPESDVPDWVRNTYLSFKNTGLKISVLVLNIPDRTKRKAVYNCLDIHSFRKAFLPSKNDFLDIQTVLPLGFPGGVAGPPKQECGRYNGLAGNTVTLANWRTDNTDDLLLFSNKFSRRTGLNLKIIGYKPAEIMSIIHKIPHPYELVQINISALNSDHNTFLSTFLKEDVYLDFDITQARKAYTQMTQEDEPSRKIELALLAAQELEKASVVLPLYQHNARIFYPPGIKNVNVGSELGWYPEVADFRW